MPAAISVSALVGQGLARALPSLTLLFLMASASGLRLMKKKLEREDLAFFYWLCFHQPHWIKAGFRKRLEDHLTIEGIEKIKSVPKSDFLVVFDMALQRH